MFEGRDVEADARAVLDTVADGGVAIIPLTVGYGIVGHAEAAVARIYEAKERSFGKPCGVFASWDMFTEVAVVDEPARAIVQSIIHTHNLPFSTVAPFRADHPMIAALDDFVLQNASKDGTMDLLMNAGALHDALARQAREREILVVGSSANKSLTGSKFRFEDIDEQVVAAADLCLDYGLSTYRNDQGLGSTIVELPSYRTIRAGCVYDALCTIFRDEAAIDLKAIAAQ